jgi:hypothetical protein
MLALLLLFAAAPEPCVAADGEVQRQLTLEYDEFDTDTGDYAWRQLNGRGCVDEALGLLEAYGKAHPSLPQSKRSEMAFHAGQALAFHGRDAEAIPYFQRALDIGGDIEWITYVAANFAFLKRDKAGLERARERYAALSPHSMRLKILDGFIACFPKSYMDAAHCGM